MTPDPNCPTCHGTGVINSGPHPTGIPDEPCPCATAEPATSVEAAVDEARKAIQCLLLAVEPDIWRDVKSKVEAAFAALRSSPPTATSGNEREVPPL